MIKIITKEDWRRKAVERGAELEKVKEQLDIAVSALEKYLSAKGRAEVIDENGEAQFSYYPLTNDDGEIAKTALAEIKELENEIPKQE